MRPTPESFAADLHGVLGRRLVSAILYGSAASGDHVARYSDYNVLLVLDRTTPATLALLGPALRAWTRAGNPLPQIMDRGFLARSADVFPLEWADMRDHHQVLHGADVLKAVRIRPTDLRAELERELKAKLLRLRGTYAAAASRPAELQELLVKSASTFLVLFRGLLRLQRVSPVPPKREAAAALARRCRINLGVFAYVEKLRTGDRTARRAPVEPQARRYLEAIEAVARKVDSWT